MSDQTNKTTNSRPTGRAHAESRGVLGRAVTRRQLLKGVGAVGATAVALDLLSACKKSDDTESTPVVVSDDQAKSILDYTLVDSLIAEDSTYKLPLGSVVFPAEGTWLPYLTMGSSANTVSIASAVSISSGDTSSVVSAPVTGSLSTVIYDARCSDKVFSWVEVDTRTKSWTLLASGFSDGKLTGSTSTLWQGDSDYDPPLMCCSGSKVFWLIMPSTGGSKTTEHSGCYVWKVGDSSAKQVVDSPGRFATMPSLSGDTITLAPRVKASDGVYYGITAYQVSDDCSTQVDQLVLPASVKPFYAVRIADKFAFSIEANYSSGGLLSNMGTYIGSGDGPFVQLSREPFADVAGKDGLYIIKSKASYFVADTSAEQYSVLTAVDHSVDYGEYPASTGMTSTFATYATIKDSSTGYPSSVVMRTFTL